jgi:hypothetical protein
MKKHRLERDPLKTNFLVDDIYRVKKKIWKEELKEREITSKIRTFKNHNMEWKFYTWTPPRFTNDANSEETASTSKVFYQLHVPLGKKSIGSENAQQNESQKSHDFFGTVKRILLNDFKKRDIIVTWIVTHWLRDY